MTFTSIKSTEFLFVAVHFFFTILKFFYLVGCQNEYLYVALLPRELITRRLAAPLYHPPFSQFTTACQSWQRKGLYCKSTYM